VLLSQSASPSVVIICSSPERLNIGFLLREKTCRCAHHTFHLEFSNCLAIIIIYYIFPRQLGTITAKAKKVEKVLADADQGRAQREQAIAQRLSQILALAGGKYRDVSFSSIYSFCFL
jgi:hypothetical protein